MCADGEKAFKGKFKVVVDRDNDGDIRLFARSRQLHPLGRRGQRLPIKGDKICRIGLYSGKPGPLEILYPLFDNGV
jgi:hypothetical protein